MSDKILCIYHGGCADGYTAAWAVWMALRENVEFHPGVYGKEPPDVTGRDVIMVDFSYKRPVLDEMARRARTIVILDHHKTAAEDLAGLPPPLDGAYSPAAMDQWARDCNGPAVHALFDMDRSGARLAWDYFHPKESVPPLVEIVEDRDLWRFTLPHTRAVMSVVQSIPYDFREWDILDVRCSTPDMLREVIAEGEAIDRKHFKDIREFIEFSSHKMTIGGHEVPALNAPWAWASDAGNIMAAGQPFAAVYCRGRGGWTFSLRSTDAGLDVSEIAKAFGGGGHRNAAGFKVKSLLEFMAE